MRIKYYVLGLSIIVGVGSALGWYGHFLIENPMRIRKSLEAELNPETQQTLNGRAVACFVSQDISLGKGRYCHWYDYRTKEVAENFYYKNCIPRNSDNWLWCIPKF